MEEETLVPIRKAICHILWGLYFIVCCKDLDLNKVTRSFTVQSVLLWHMSLTFYVFEIKRLNELKDPQYFSPYKVFTMKFITENPRLFVLHSCSTLVLVILCTLRSFAFLYLFLLIGVVYELLGIVIYLRISSFSQKPFKKYLLSNLINCTGNIHSIKLILSVLFALGCLGVVRRAEVPYHRFLLYLPWLGVFGVYAAVVGGTFASVFIKSANPGRNGKEWEQDDSNATACAPFGEATLQSWAELAQVLLYRRGTVFEVHARVH